MNCYAHYADDDTSSEEIHQYLQDLAKMPVLSIKAEQEIIRQIAANPLAKEANHARNMLVEGNLHLPVRLARRYHPFGPELADLVQEGNLALINAARQFDPMRGQHFRPFARQRICWALYHVVEEHLRERHLEQEMEPIHPLRTQVLKALAHNAIDEQALVLDLPEERWVSLNTLLQEANTDNFITDDCSSICLYDSSGEAPDEIYLIREREKVIASCLQTLTLKERLVLVHHYLLGIPQTLGEVGKVLGISRERARQLEEQGIRKLRHPSTSRTLRSLL